MNGATHADCVLCGGIDNAPTPAQRNRCTYMLVLLRDMLAYVCALSVVVAISILIQKRMFPIEANQMRET